MGQGQRRCVESHTRLLRKVLVSARGAMGSVKTRGVRLDIPSWQLHGAGCAGVVGHAPVSR